MASSRSCIERGGPARRASFHFLSCCCQTKWYSRELRSFYVTRDTETRKGEGVQGDKKSERLQADGDQEVEGGPIDLPLLAFSWNHFRFAASSFSSDMLRTHTHTHTHTGHQDRARFCAVRETGESRTNCGFMQFCIALNGPRHAQLTEMVRPAAQSVKSVERGMLS